MTRRGSAFSSGEVVRRVRHFYGKKYVGFFLWLLYKWQWHRGDDMREIKHSSANGGDYYSYIAFIGDWDNSHSVICTYD